MEVGRERERGLEEEVALPLEKRKNKNVFFFFFEWGYELGYKFFFEAHHFWMPNSVELFAPPQERAYIYAPNRDANSQKLWIPHNP